jgi:predicted nucleic acid-binding protein
LTFVDTNILIDIASGNPAWAGWSRQALVSAHAKGKVLFNAIVYAEFAVSFETEAECDAEIDKFELSFVEIPKSAAFRAAQAFRAYRRAGGARSVVLPDFFIGAHASVLRVALLTRDAKRYRSYFPEATIIAPKDP